MISVIAIWTMLPETQTEALTALNQLAKEVEAKESGTLMYLPQSTNMAGYNNPVPCDGQIVFIEVYKDQAAFDFHLYGPNGQNNPSGSFVDFVNEYGDLFLRNKSDGKPYMHVFSLDLFTGFVREEMGQLLSENCKS